VSQVVLLTDLLSNQQCGDSRYIGPYVVASELEQNGFDVAVIDYFTRIPDFFSYLENFIGPETLFVGLSTTFLFPPASVSRVNRSEMNANFWNPGLWLSTTEELEMWLAQLRALLDKYNPQAKIIFGGGKASLGLQKKSYYKDIDYISLGISDKSIIKFALDLKRDLVPDAILSYQGTSILNNFEEVGLRYCPETKFTSRYAIQPNESLPIEVSRGCIYNCRFCYYEKKVSSRKDSEILYREFLYNYENFGTTVYNFCDDCFNDSKPKVFEICSTIMRLPFKIEWVSYARVDWAIKAPETLEMMIESGARGLFFGIESFNSEVAKKAGKGVPSERVKEFLIEFKKKYYDRCFINASFISGLPGETIESLNETKKWLQDNDVLDFLSFGPLMVDKFHEKLDKITVDFADYSRNPEAHGFKVIQYDPPYWEHDTMNYNEACDMVVSITDDWKAKRTVFLTSSWYYPVMRTLGYSWEDICQMSRDPSTKAKWDIDVPQRYSKFLENYHRDLLANNEKHKSHMHLSAFAPTAELSL
jgi:radical SAM superfamily enzyme YgiQ (UPF0313 family)